MALAPPLEALAIALNCASRLSPYGHACVDVKTPGGKTILIDPWFSNPKSPNAADAVTSCDLLLVTHGHGDHMGDAVALASRLRPTWPCIHEMGIWLARRLPGGADAATGMNKGGTFAFGDIGEGSASGLKEREWVEFACRRAACVFRANPIRCFGSIRSAVSELSITPAWRP